MNTIGIYLVPFLIFIAVVIFIEGLYLLWNSSQHAGAAKMQSRLRTLSAGGAHGAGSIDLLHSREFSSTAWLNRVLAAIPRVHAIDRVLVQANLSLNITQFFSLQLALAIFASLLLAFLTMAPLVIAVLFGSALGLFAPYIYAVARGRKRHELFVRLFPDALDFIARSLRAGNPFSASIRIASEEMADPISTEFGIVFDEMNYGLDLEDALHNLGSRVDCQETRYFVTAVLIQKTTGGNLADVLNKIAGVMRDRVKTHNEIKVQAAEMKISAYILIALPFFVGGAIALLNPKYFTPLLGHPMGLVIIGAQIVLMLLGFIVIRRMISFRI